MAQLRLSRPPLPENFGDGLAFHAPTQELIHSLAARGNVDDLALSLQEGLEGSVGLMRVHARVLSRARTRAQPRFVLPLFPVSRCAYNQLPPASPPAPGPQNPWQS